MNAEGYTRREQELSGWSILLETYRLGDKYFCTISSVDPARDSRAPRVRRAKTPSASPSKKPPAGSARRGGSPSIRNPRRTDSARRRGSPSICNPRQADLKVRPTRDRVPSHVVPHM